MTIAILKEFIDLAYTLNFSASAARMFISQSTLSKHISSMEDELGVQLFVRSKHSVRLTDSGRKFYERIKPVVLQYDAAVRELQASQETLTGSLRFGFIITTDFITSAVRTFREQYPHVQLSLVTDEIGTLERGVRNDMLDLCITAQFATSAPSRELSFHRLTTDRLAAIVPKNHPLASRPYITFSELLDYPLAIPSERQYPDYYRLMQQMFTQLDKYPDIVCEFSYTHAAVLMAESGTAISVLASQSYFPSEDTVKLEIMDPEAVLSIGVLWKTNNTAPGLRQFVDALIEAVVKYPPGGAQ